jgi:nicotinate-nucleotide adenylyltransferase
VSEAVAATPTVAAPPAVAPPAPVIAGSLGILGGTFDPIHHGHLAIAEDAREALGLERVLLIPAATPPHKPGRPVTPAADRLAMLELAIAGNPAFVVSRVELDRGGRSYTVDTLEALHAERGTGAAEPWFILSAEALAEFSTWRRPDRILELCRLAVVPRSGHEPLDVAWVTANLPGRASRVRFLPGPLLPISGSVVRRRAAAGRSVRYLVPDAVARYIAEHRLYTEPARRTQTP